MHLSFRPITLQDKELITAFTLPCDNKNCDFSFANMCSWRFLYDSVFTIVDGFLLIRFIMEEKDRIAYMMPIGLPDKSLSDMAQAIHWIEEDSLAQGHPLCMLGITPENRQTLEAIFPHDFVYMPQRDYFDYIYLREDLANLKGKKYQQKRNHINNFKNLYNYEYIPITPEIVPQCLELERKWFKANNNDQEEEELCEERKALTYALLHARELGLIGGAIRIEGKIAAFSFGAPINHNTFGVHVEKADVAYEGAYTLINQAFAAHLPEQYVYVNREEDRGIPGLRQAKLSYHPAILLEKYTTLKKSEETNII